MWETLSSEYKLSVCLRLKNFYLSRIPEIVDLLLDLSYIKLCCDLT